MIKKVTNVSLFVNDQDRALAFYTEKLGFEVRMDASFTSPETGISGRWLAVAPKGAETEVSLYKIDSNWEHYAGVVGKQQAVVFEVIDIHNFVQKLKDQGIKVTHGPTEEPWGTFAMILDSENNNLMIVEERKG